MKRIQQTGLGIFVAAMLLFTAIPFMTSYEVNEANLNQLATFIKEGHRTYLLAELSKREGRQRSGKPAFIARSKAAITAANEAIAGRYQLRDETIQSYINAALVELGGKYSVTETSREAAGRQIPEQMRQTINDYTSWLLDRSFDNLDQYAETVDGALRSAVNGLVSSAQINEYDQKEYLFSILKANSTGFFWNHKGIFFILIFILGTLGALMWIFPAFYDGMPGIKHNHIYHNSSTSRGIVGIVIGAYLIMFYILLYFYHYTIVEWIALVDPVSIALRGEEAGRWFMYGFIYTLVVLVMGIRMFAKYRHSAYHQIRTVSVIFFQTAFAFLIPQLLYHLNQPEMDLKNIWPLNYSFFFDWNINAHIQGGSLGIFMLGWGIALFVIGVPLFTYFYGKRWYCSWVCGCGGLAETLGDPFRQLSDKSLTSWKIERYLVHGVLVFAGIMTVAVLYTFFTGNSQVLGLNSYSVREIYGFAIGSVFAGVVGTGFYPLMGNRVWCRFGCPLAAYLGIVQRFKSRFRITTNGGQCISCGNCSTYCEMGIDVRWYAQRGQNIVRASCVGCGVCAAVCPRGVLALENLDDTDGKRMEKVQY